MFLSRSFGLFSLTLLMSVIDFTRSCFMLHCRDLESDPRLRYPSQGFLRHDEYDSFVFVSP